jgi:hypothetical protein
VSTCKLGKVLGWQATQYMVWSGAQTVEHEQECLPGKAGITQALSLREATAESSSALASLKAVRVEDTKFGVPMGTPTTTKPDGCAADIRDARFEVGLGGAYLGLLPLPYA